jgi:hypothetical protein
MGIASFISGPRRALRRHRDDPRCGAGTALREPSGVKRNHDDLQAKAETAAKEKKTSRADKAPADPVTVAKRERDTQLRELTDQAHGANVDLGHSLVHNLSSVDPTDIDVTRFFVLCGPPHSTNYADV